MPPPNRLREWAVEIVKQELLNAGKAGADSWSNWPVPDKRSAENPWVRQIRISSDGDDSAPFLCSLPRGEQLTGRLRSPEFEAPPKLSFYIAGHAGFPDKPLHGENYIAVRDAKTGEIWMQTLPPRNDTAQPVEWDLSNHRGKRAVIEIVDGDDAGAFAWLAVGRFEPAVISVPDAESQGPEGRFRDAANLAADLRLESMADDFAAVVQNAASGALIRTVALTAWSRLKNDTVAAAAAIIAAEPVLSESVRESVLSAALEQEASQRGSLLGESLKALSSRSQTRVAEALAGDLAGSRLLVALSSEGRISPRLLRAGSIAPRLAALRNTELDASVNALLADLPSEAETLSALIEVRREGFRGTSHDLSVGQALFKKHCAACHQVAGDGAVVGPQLDGIGLRGLDRLAEDLLAPSRNVDPAFRMTTLVLTNGLSRQGLLRREEGSQLVLVDNKGEEFRVNAADVEERVTSSASLMPDNVAEALTEAEFYNLLGWLLSQRKALEPGVTPESGSNQ
jgi:putative heme-binding domain-containing protein